MDSRRYNVTVSVPYSKKMPYSLYAKGSSIDIPHFDENKEFCNFKYGGGTVIVLFYTFNDFRRAYIVTGWKNDKDGESITLPGVDGKLCLIFMAKGRKIDLLKRVLFILTDEQGDEHKAFSLPLIFWYKVAAMIQHDGAVRSDLAILWESFTKKKLLCLTKKERNLIRKRKLGLQEKPQ